MHSLITQSNFWKTFEREFRRVLFYLFCLRLEPNKLYIKIPFRIYLRQAPINGASVYWLFLFGKQWLDYVYKNTSRVVQTNCDLETALLHYIDDVGRKYFVCIGLRHFPTLQGVFFILRLIYNLLKTEIYATVNSKLLLLKPWIYQQPRL